MMENGYLFYNKKGLSIFKQILKLLLKKKKKKKIKNFFLEKFYIKKKKNIYKFL